MREEIELQAGNALVNRLWWHTLGVVNGKRLAGHLPDGRSAEEEQPGAASAIRWGEHRCILTAQHVVENAKPGDLRFFCRPTGTLERTSVEEIEKEGFIEVYAGFSLSLTDMHFCKCEDMVVLTLDPRAGPLNAEFHDILHLNLDPAEGARIYSFGFPSDRALDVTPSRVGDREYRARLLTPMLWETVVVSNPSNLLESSSEKNPFYFAAWNPNEQGRKPHGLSGGVVWMLSPLRSDAVWAATVLFAGICTDYYPSRNAERIIKASTVVKFLEDALGPVST